MIAGLCRLDRLLAGTSTAATLPKWNRQNALTLGGAAAHRRLLFDKCIPPCIVVCVPRNGLL